MTKIGNYKKETIRNGAMLTGGHRIKYASDDKTFLIVLTPSGDYKGLYITFEKDGAYVDEERTVPPLTLMTFNSLENAKTYFKVDEALAVEEKKSEEAPKKAAMDTMKIFNEMKAKHPTAVFLFRKGDFYECYDEDASVAADVLGIILTTRGEHKMAGFPIHAFDIYLPKLVKAGKKVAVCDPLEDPKKVENSIKSSIEQVKNEEKTAKVVSMDVADAIVHELHITKPETSQNDMRKAVVDACNKEGIVTDHVSIWQHNGNGDYGLAVAFNGKKPVAVVNWERTKTNGKSVYSFVSESNEKFQALRSRI